MLQSAMKKINKNEKQLDIEQYTRFAIWNENKPIGQYLIFISDITLDNTIEYNIEKVIEYSEDGINLAWEDTKLIWDGFVHEKAEQIVDIIANGEDNYVDGYYIKIFTPMKPKFKWNNPIYLDCKSPHLKASEFQEKILDKIGETTYLEVRDAIEQGKKITYRYINEIYYKDDMLRNGSRIRYSQIFVDGENLGWCENHPKMTLKELKDGRKIWIGNPTIYYDFINKAYELGLTRTNSLNCWMKKDQ